MEDNIEKYTLGSKELGKELESKYYKFALGQPQNILINSELEIIKRIVEFTNNEDKKQIQTKYDINIIVENEDKLWSVSKKVLTTINDHIKNTKKFKIILREKSYDVIPLGLKEW